VNSGPVCITARSLKVFRGKTFERTGKIFTVVKAIWKPNQSAGIEVALKYLKKQHDKDDHYLKVPHFLIANLLTIQFRDQWRNDLFFRSFWK